MAKIRIIVMGFASHRTWAEGYQRADHRAGKHNNIQINVISPEKWKFRMMVASVEFVDLVEDDDDTVIVDGMFDISVLVALLKSKTRKNTNKCPKILVYLHENQLTTPFTNQDRDLKNQTSWHYGMAHYRSLMVADGFIFNSQTHLDSFKQALPKAINEQCPRDTIQYHLQNLQELLQTKCTTLQYGLELDELEQLNYKVDHKVDNDGGDDNNDQQQPIISSNNLERTNTKKKKIIPTILWNARLEEDKNPAAFLDMLHQIRRRKLKRRSNKEEDDEENNNKSDDQQEVAFQLIILGMDPSKDKIWEKRIQKEFSKELLFMGWCTDRKQYSSWLHKSSIIISTAKHETVGISVVESVYCGALPLLPNRLSYPELFPPDIFMENHLYSTTRGDGVDKLLRLLDIVANHPTRHHQLQQQTKSAISRFRWSIMGSIYDDFFDDIVAGEPLTLAGIKAESTLKMTILDEKDGDGDGDGLIAPRANGEKILTTNTLDAAADTTTVPWQLRQEEIIKDATDDRVALYRPKSLRNHSEYNKQIKDLDAVEVTLHGGRRATVRMLEAMFVTGALIKPISFLTTRELANTIFLGEGGGTGGGIEGTIQSKQQQDKRRCLLLKDTPIYVADNKELLDEIRGQKLNSGDSVLCMIQFPISCDDLSELIANPPILILDNVRNAENVGSILRTAFCLGITSVVATSGTAWAAIKDSRAARCSMGTMYYHKYYQSTNLVQTIKTIQEKGDGIKVYGVEIGSNAVPVQPHGTNKNWAAIVGNEDIGLNNHVASACDKIVFIPQYHGDSLNVGHAAAITMFELGRECNSSSTATTQIKHDGLAACT